MPSNTAAVAMEMLVIAVRAVGVQPGHSKAQVAMPQLIESAGSQAP